MFTEVPWNVRIREAAERFQNATVTVYRLGGEDAPFDVETNTGGSRVRIPVYKGKARVQEVSANRDHEGSTVRNPNSEVLMRFQLPPHSGWADDFDSPTSYTSELGARRLLRDWQILVTDGADNPGLTRMSFTIDTNVNSSHMAVVDILCTFTPDVEVS